MNAPSLWGKTPKESIETACLHRGIEVVRAACVELLHGVTPEPDLLLALAGPAGAKFLDGRPHHDSYWLRVWGARGLLWVWDDRLSEELRAALDDESWRVREMALKVVARHRLEDLADETWALREDPVARVRATASRALNRFGAP